jgi:hypothetical protein
VRDYYFYSHGKVMAEYRRVAEYSDELMEVWMIMRVIALAAWFDYFRGVSLFG